MRLGNLDIKATCVPLSIEAACQQVRSADVVCQAFECVVALPDICSAVRYGTVDVDNDHAGVGGMHCCSCSVSVYWLLVFEVLP